MNTSEESKHVTNENMSEENALPTPSPIEEGTSATEKEETISSGNTIDSFNEEIPSKIESVTEPLVEEEFSVTFEKLTKDEIIERLKEVVNLKIDEKVKAEVDSLKQAFYKLKRTESENAKENETSNEETENEEETKVIAVPDEAEEKLKQLLQIFKEKRAALIAETEKIKEENLKIKTGIIEELKNLIESQDDFYKVYNEFRRLQQQWKEIKLVPQGSVNDLWKEYQHYSEKFYDLIKINNEMRDYDFKKNLELKTKICESVEKLEEEPDVISAFYQLQKFHQEWREIGPVAKELREEIWTRFKKTSTAVNKKHQEYFEALREMEQRNLDEKTAICEEMEKIDYSTLNSFKEWDEQNKIVLELQEKWKTIGFAPKKNNTKIFERFRSACDAFFQQKSDFYKSVKEQMDSNLEKKKGLCDIAESLKDSEEWKETTDKLIALQKEWKTIGAVSRKHSDIVWKRFVTACDYFFEQKNKHFSSQRSEEQENLKKKKEIIEKIEAVSSELSAQEAITQIRELMSEWNDVGFVPFREKDKIYKEYRTAVDKHFDRLKVNESERRLQSFKSNVSEMVGQDKPKGKILNEREKLLRNYERLKNDIQTYENNIGFLSVSSKGGGGLVKEMSRKIESLKEELDLILKKIEVIDLNLDNSNG